MMKRYTIDLDDSTKFHFYLDTFSGDCGTTIFSNGMKINNVTGEKKLTDKELKYVLNVLRAIFNPYERSTKGEKKLIAGYNITSVYETERIIKAFDDTQTIITPDAHGYCDYGYTVAIIDRNIDKTLNTEILIGNTHTRKSHIRKIVNGRMR